MTRYWIMAAGALAAMGCTTGGHSRREDGMSRPPGVQVTLLREASASHTWSPWRAQDLFPAKDPITVEVSVTESAHVSVLLYSPQGESEDLAGSSGLRMVAGASQRFPVPRRAPPGIQETELRMYVIASAAPLSAAARGLFRLRCGVPADGGRGNDREDDEPKTEGKPSEKKRGSDEKSPPPAKSAAPADKGTSSGASGQPEEGDHKGPGDAKLCAVTAGQFHAMTVIPIVVRSL